MIKFKKSLFFLLCLFLVVFVGAAGTSFAAEYDLVLNHDDSPDPAIAGGEVTYTIRVTNNGEQYSVDDVQLTNTLPSGIVFVSAVASQGSCGAPSGSDPDRQVICNLGTLAPQAEATVVVRVRTIQSGAITNKASVTSTTPGFIDPDTNNNSQDELTTVNAGANLALTKIASPTPSVQSGATLAYTLTVTNAGPDAATDVQVVDNLPTGFAFIGSPPSGCTRVGQVLTCILSGSIAAGGNRVIGPFSGTVTAASPSTLTNSASATITSPTAPQDPDTSDNTVTVNTEVTAGFDLAITKTQSVPNPIIQGNSFSYDLTVTSTGDNPSNIEVTDTIPVNFTVGTPSGTGWACSVASQLVICTRAAGIGSGVQTLPAITIPVTAQTTGSGIVNTGTVNSTTPGFTDPFPGNNSSSVTTNILGDNADLRANKSVRRANGTALTPLLVEQGVQFRYRISVTNLGPSPVASGSTLTMIDTIPAGITADSYAVTNGWICTALPLSGPATITCTRAFPTGLAVNATSEVDIYVTATTTGALTNQVCASGGEPEDVNPANDCASVTVTSQTNPTDLQVFKTDSPDPVDAGDILTYTIEIVNVSTVTATSVTLTDTFTSLINNSVGATGAGFIDAVVAPGNATGGSCTSAGLSDNRRRITCTFTSIPQCTQGDNCPIVTARVRPRGQGDRTNSAYAVSSDIVDANIADNTSATITTLVNPIADVRATITDTPDPLAVGTNLTYVGTIINDGPSNAADGTITITLPEGVAFLSASPSAGSCSITPGSSGTITTAVNKTVTCNLGSIALLGGQRTVTIIVRPTLAVSALFPATITASAEVSTTTTESNTGNNGPMGTNTLVTNPSHDLLLNKTDSPDPVAVGDPVTYTITATNNGPSYATAVQVVDNLPSTRLSFVSATPSTGSCGAPVGNVLTCDLGDIPVTENRTISVEMRGIQKGVDNNSATVSSAETRAGYPDTLPANNSVTEDTTVRSKVDIEILSKVPSLSTVEMRQPFNWTISIRNNTGGGLAEADNVVLSDTLPAGMELTGTPIINVTNGTFSIMTCTGSAGQTAFSCSLGTVSNGATGTIMVPVKVTAYPAAPHTTTNCASLATVSIDINSANNTNICGTVTVEQGSSIAGFVYLDRNNDGVMGGGESGIAGVQLTLTGIDTYGNTVNVTVTTDSTGAYFFNDLPLSNAAGYTITETQPAAWADGLDSVGTAGGTLVSSDVISGIILTALTTATGYNFGERGGSLAGYVYNDANNNGIKEAGEQGIQGVTVTLAGTDFNGNAVNITTITAADGSYSFADLPRPNASGYTITETQPSGYADGIDTVGSLGGSSPANDTFLIGQAVFPAGASGTGYNFGERVAAYAQVSGRVWFDADHDREDDEGLSAGRPGWIVELIKRDNPLDNSAYTIINQAITDANGEYAFINLLPNNESLPTDRYEIRFRHPLSNTIFGIPVSTLSGVDLSYGTIRNILLNAGDTVIDQSLPLDPGGIVYDSVTRQPVNGATVTITGPAGFDPAIHLVGGTANASQVTGIEGIYQFILLSTAPAGSYGLTVNVPAGYLPFPSSIIPSCTNTLDVSGTPSPLLIQTSNVAPTTSTPLHAPGSCASSSGGVSAGAGTTQYYLSFDLTPGTSASVINNHIPIDPILGGAIIATKTTPLVNVKIGDLVPYTMTMTNTLSATLANIDVRDIIPPGFKYRKGSARLNGVKNEPVIAGRQLTWPNLTFAPGERKTFTMILVVGAGVGVGEYTNQVYALNNLINTVVSNVATATVRVIPDATFDCTDIIGKVFDDKNINGYQDEGEPGIANVRLATARGLIVTTDAEGRFHIPCAHVPHTDRGSNFIMKVDERTLPSGFRMTTENPYTVRATRGKMIKMNFGAAIHRVVRIDVSDAAFEPDSENLRSEWQEKMQALEKTLRESPTVVRLAYRMNADSKSLVKKRIKAMRETLTVIWKKGKNCPPLIFEEEIVEAKQ